MSSLIDTISRDIAEYERLCYKYNEVVEYSAAATYGHRPVPNCYGKHAKKLKQREKDESKE
jgi:hypothetical protein